MQNVCFVMSGHGCHAVVVTSEGCLGARKASESEPPFGMLSARASYCFVSVQLRNDKNLFFSCVSNLHSGAITMEQIAGAVCGVYGIVYTGYYLTNLACKLTFSLDVT